MKYILAIILFLLGTNTISITKPPLPEKEKTVRILLVGDIMLDRNVYLLAKEKNDFEYPFRLIDPLFSQYDIRVGNLEGPITNNASVAVNSQRLQFTFSPLFLPELKKRFEVLSLANNHMQDMGESGFTETKENLSREGITFFGDYYNREGMLSTEIDEEHIKIAFVGLHDFSSGNIISEIKKLRLRNDVVIVMPHWGVEYDLLPSERQKNLAHQFIDAGTDVVLGSHPHVVQSSEEYKGKQIYYSLGNFIFDQYFSKETQSGIMVVLTVTKDSGLISIKHKALPFKSVNSQPTVIEKY